MTISMLTQNTFRIKNSKIFKDNCANCEKEFFETWKKKSFLPVKFF